MTESALPPRFVDPPANGSAASPWSASVNPSTGGAADGLVLCMIMRNEARCIARCLTSVRPFVDRMVVVDTGSTDDSVTKALAEGAEVLRMQWPDDFAAARNAALDLAGDYAYALVLDADETLAQGGEQLREFVRAAADQVAAGSAAPLGVVRVDSVFEQDGQRLTAPSWISRLLPAGVRYTGRVHEQPVSDGPRQRLPVVVDHDGYQAAPMAAKQGRNRALLLADLAQSPHDAYLHYQLGKDAAVHGDLPRAITAFQQAMTLTPRTEPYRHDLVLRLLTSLKHARRYDDALALAAVEAPSWDHSPDFHFVLGDLALDCAVADPANAVQTFFPMIEHHWLRALALGDRLDLEGAVIGRGSFLAAHNLAVYYQISGNGAKAAGYKALSLELRV